MGKKRVQDSDEEELAYPSAEEEVSPPLKKAKKAKAQKQKETEDSNEKASKSKITKKGNVSDVILANSDGEKFIDLGKKRRVTIRSFKGQPLIDIREFYGDEDDLKPGKKGISLSPDQWRELSSNAAKIDGLISQL